MNDTGPTSESAPLSEESQWFLQNVRPHEPLLRNYLNSSFRHLRDLDDIVQESYLRIWKARKAGPVRSAKAFLFGVARHVAIDLLRRQKSAPIQPMPDLAALSVLDHGPAADEAAAARDEARLLAEALHSLPPRCCEIVILKKIKGLSQKEIARTLGISEQTVQSQVFRGVRRCAKFLAERGVRRNLESDDA